MVRYRLRVAGAQRRADGAVVLRGLRAVVEQQVGPRRRWMPFVEGEVVGLTGRPDGSITLRMAPT